MLSTRPSDDELFMRVAHQVATRSLCDRDQVGAVIVDTQLRITGTGRNGPPAGFEHQERTCTEWCVRAKNLAHNRPGYVIDPSYSDCPSLHAEVNALLTSDRSRHEGGTIYVTSPPCWSCGKMIANSGLLTVVVEFDPLKFAERLAENTYKFLEQLGINVVIIDTKGTGQ
jgi:dCMP deaminase